MNGFVTMCRDQNFFDPQEIKRTVSLLKPNNELFEIRILRGRQVLSGYFKDSDTLINALHKLSSEVLSRGQIYITLQEIHPGCEARVQWEIFLDSKYEQLNTTSDNDILRYRYLPIDLDPVRPAGISSTNEELKAAADVAREIISFMSAQGYSKHILAFSGNGYHVLFPVNVDATNREIIEEELQRLDSMFSTSKCKVDTTLANPARIIKVYGTFAHKGRSTQDRPHRISKILEVVGYENQ